jgi:hypothetical protein
MALKFGAFGCPNPMTGPSRLTTGTTTTRKTPTHMASVEKRCSAVARLRSRSMRYAD